MCVCVCVCVCMCKYVIYTYITIYSRTVPNQLMRVNIYQMHIEQFAQKVFHV